MEKSKWQHMCVRHWKGKGGSEVGEPMSYLEQEEWQSMWKQNLVGEN